MRTHLISILINNLKKKGKKHQQRQNHLFPFIYFIFCSVLLFTLYCLFAANATQVLHQSGLIKAIATLVNVSLAIICDDIHRSRSYVFHCTHVGVEETYI